VSTPIASASAATPAAEDEPLSVERIDEIRDFYVWDNPDQNEAVANSFCFRARPGFVRIAGTEIEGWLDGLLSHIRQKHAEDTDFTVTYGDFIFRGHRDHTVDGALLALRRIPKHVPRLQDLTFPNNWTDFFLLPSLLKGGLVLIAAVTGQGKSTTLGAIVKSRLEEFGGFCRTIEDPPELLLHGAHGNGICVQTPVESSGPNASTYAAALKSALRSYPTIPSGGTICMVGEVRDPETAADLVRAAVNGHLVLTTVHAADVATAVGRLYALAAAAMDPGAAKDLLSSAVRIVVHQELEIDHKEAGWRKGRLKGDLVYSGGSSSALANVIKEGKIASGMNQIVSTQATLVRQTRRGSMAELLHRLDGTQQRNG